MCLSKLVHDRKRKEKEIITTDQECEGEKKQQKGCDNTLYS